MMSSGVATAVDPTLPSWGVHASVDETTELLCAYVAHHVSIGASEVHLFLDRDNPEARRILGRIPQCRLTLCDDAYWTASVFRARPDKAIDRQMHNATLAHRTSNMDWLLHCDADEFLHSDRPIAEILGTIKPEVDYLHLPNVERAFRIGAERKHIFEGLFRVPLKRFQKIGVEIYGDDAIWFTKGLVGHVKGKSFARTGRPLRIQAHMPVFDGAYVKTALYRMSKAASAAIEKRDEFALQQSVHSGASAPDADARFDKTPDRARFDLLAPVHWLFASAFGLAYFTYRFGRRLFAGDRSPKTPSARGRPQKPVREQILHAPYRELIGAESEEAVIVHFDALTPLHWTIKHLRSYLARQTIQTEDTAPTWNRRAEARVLQINSVYEARSDPAALNEIVERILFLSDAQIDMLRPLGGLADVSVDPTVAVAACFPDVALSYDPEVFDAKQRERFRDSLEGTAI